MTAWTRALPARYRASFALREALYAFKSRMRPRSLCSTVQMRPLTRRHRGVAMRTMRPAASNRCTRLTPKLVQREK